MKKNKLSKDRLLKEIFSINNFILRKNIKTIDKLFSEIDEGIKEKRFKLIKSVEIKTIIKNNKQRPSSVSKNTIIESDTLKGLFYYYILNEFNKLYYETAQSIKGWGILNYYYCLLSINSNFYKIIADNLFIKYVNEIIITNNVRKLYNSKIIDISDLSKQGHKIIKMFSKINVNNFLNDIKLIENELRTQKEKKIEAYNELEKKDQIITNYRTQLPAIPRHILLFWQSETNGRRQINGISKNKYYENLFKPKYPELKTINFKRFNNTYHQNKHRGKL